MDNANEKQTLLLENRKTLTVDGIKNVAGFRDDYIELLSNLGRIEIEGADLKIEELCRESGKILVTGEISGVFYGDNKTGKKIFGKIFK